jgi:hypothetical protein
MNSNRNPSRRMLLAAVTLAALLVGAVSSSFAGTTNWNGDTSTINWSPSASTGTNDTSEINLLQPNSLSVGSTSQVFGSSGSTFVGSASNGLTFLNVRPNGAIPAGAEPPAVPEPGPLMLALAALVPVTLLSLRKRAPKAG